MIASFFYDLALFILGLIALPKLLWDFLKKGKYRTSLGARFGFHLPQAPKDKKGPVIWFHAVSVGESKAIVPLFRALVKKYPKAAFFISSTTETGHEEAKRSLEGATGYFFLPFDFSWIINKTIKQLRPDLLILGEGDFWYHLLKKSKKRGAKCLLINGKISERSRSRFLRVSFFSRSLFNLLDVFCVQSFRYAERFLSLGVEKQKISITGNLKLDACPTFLSEEEKQKWKERLGISKEERLLVIGSTHPKEEILLLSALKPLWQTSLQLKILIAPRHPERFPSVIEQLKEQGYCVRAYSEPVSNSPSEVIVIDAMGILQNLYQLADIALVGGSFVSGIGGHNIFEPIQFGIPTLFGPYMESQLDLVHLILDQQAGIQTELKHLLKTILNLLQSPEKHMALSICAHKIAKEARGATQRTLEILENYLV